MYCIATIEEIQRISGVGPGSLPHVVTKDVEINGFHFPKGSIFMANITKFLRDPCAFPEPTRFLPERFLTNDKDGTRILQVFWYWLQDYNISLWSLYSYINAVFIKYFRLEKQTKHTIWYWKTRLSRRIISTNGAFHIPCDDATKTEFWPSR